MKEEVQVAAKFISTLLPKSVVKKDSIICFSNNLAHLLTDRCYSSKWDSHAPLIGSAYRAVTCFNGHLDSVIYDAACRSDITFSILQTYLPKEFVVWIDPRSVSYRIGNIDNIVELSLSKNKKNKNHIRIEDPKTGEIVDLT
jgi:hypothetical protein